MLNRRRFFWQTIGSLGALLGHSKATQARSASLLHNHGGPFVIATWENLPAVRIALEALQQQARPLDAVEAGVRYVEADPNDHSVGYGGVPDAKGKVTLDACIMDEAGNAGSVTFVQHIMHPVSVARLVMEKTPHVMLSGKGAEEFAFAQGFKRQNLLTPKAKAIWQELRREQRELEVPTSGAQNHDTIGMITMGQDGRIAGACSTSGLANKPHGRIGDSPIIGAGLYVDPEVGAATSTGMGEYILEAVGSFLVVELMRNGVSPLDACKEAVRRINKKFPPGTTRHMVGFVALRKDGAHAAFANDPTFRYTIGDTTGVRAYDAEWA